MTRSNDGRRRLSCATMVALFGSAGLGAHLESEEHVVWLPEHRLIPVEAAIERIATLPTAICCVGVAVGSALNIGTWSGLSTNPFGEGVLELVRESVEQCWPEAQAEGVEVIVRAAKGDVAHLSWAEFETWRREYVVPLSEMMIDPIPNSSGGNRRLSVLIAPPRDGGTLLAKLRPTG